MLFPLQMTQEQVALYIVIPIIVCAANFVEAVAGFGSTILALTLGAHLAPLEFLIPALVPLNLLLSTSLVTRGSQHVNLSVLGRQMLPVAAIGLVVGIILFNHVPHRELKWAFGAVVCAIASWELWKESRRVRDRTRLRIKPLHPGLGALWLLGGGIMQGLYASGGPMVVFFASRAIPDKRAFRSTLSALWLILNIVLASSLLMTGQINKETAIETGILLPGLAIGLLLGEWGHRKIPQTGFRVLVFGLLLIAGGTLLFR